MLHFIRPFFLTLIALTFSSTDPCFAQNKNDSLILLKPARVFDGENMHEGWQILIRNNRIEKAGIISSSLPGTKIIELPDCTLLPGLIEGHSHLFLHPYNETPRNE